MTVDGVEVAERRAAVGGASFRSGPPRVPRSPRTARSCSASTPFDVIDLDVPEAGLTGVAFVLPPPVNPAARGGPPRLPEAHAARRERRGPAAGLGVLRPLRGGRRRTAADRRPRGAVRRRPARRHPRGARATSCRGTGWYGWPRRTRRGCAQFLGVHHLGVKSLALHDADMLRLVDQWWPMETYGGPMTLAGVPAPAPRRSATPRPPRSSASWPRSPRAQGVGLVNGGYAYDTEIIERLPEIDPDAVLKRLDADRAGTRFDVRRTRRRAARCGRSWRRAAGRGPARLRGRAPRVRPGVAARAVPDEPRRAYQAQYEEARQGADELWAGVLGALNGTTASDRPQLVLNHRNPLVRRITALTDAGLVGLAVQAPVRPGAAARPSSAPRRPTRPLLNRSFLGLLEWAVPTPHERSCTGTDGPCRARCRTATARTPLTEEAAPPRGGVRRRGPRLPGRLGLTTAYQYGGETAKTFASFSAAWPT